MARNPDRGCEAGASTVLTRRSSGWLFDSSGVYRQFNQKANKVAEAIRSPPWLRNKQPFFMAKRAQIFGKGVLVRSYGRNLENKILLVAQTLLYHIHID
jgi:hypothetical protein